MWLHLVAYAICQDKSVYVVDAVCTSYKTGVISTAFLFYRFVNEIFGNFFMKHLEGVDTSFDF